VSFCLRFRRAAHGESSARADRLVLALA
jgi:hypothetical protein